MQFNFNLKIMSIFDKIKQFFVRENLTPQQIEQNKTRVKLFENEQFIIYTEFVHFKKYLQDRIVKCNNSRDVQLMTAVEQETLNNELVDAEFIHEGFYSDYPVEKRKYSLRFPMTLARMRSDLLQKKKCRVYSKLTKNYVSKIVVLNYETDGFRFLAGERGRIFIGDGIEIFRSVDCVS